MTTIPTKARRRKHRVAADPGALAADLRERQRALAACREEASSARLRVTDAIARLACIPRASAVIAAAPGELAEACGFGRVVVTAVRGARWTPRTSYADSPARRVHPGGAAVLGVPVRPGLRYETELARRRIPIHVGDATLPEAASVVLPAATSYTAAPVLIEGRVTGALHADRLGQERPVEAQDVADLVAFAGQLALLLEVRLLAAQLVGLTAELNERLAAIADGVRAIGVRPVTDEPGWRADRRRRPAAGSPSPSPALRVLTPRQLEVLRLAAAGATNAEIADRLRITPVTVKSHMKAILKAVRAGSRSEAAVWLHRHEAAAAGSANPLAGSRRAVTPQPVTRSS